jgi:hypothetical protein
MQIAVVIERVAGNGYRARGELLGLCAEAPTREAALTKLREQLQERLREGTEIVPLEVGSATNPWVEFAGMFQGNPLFDDVQQIMADNRQRDEADPDYP